jgi:hypothetical protein
MKTSDLNNPHRSVPNRLGKVKGGSFVFNEPKTPPKKGYVREIEPWEEFQESLQEFTEEGGDGIVVEVEVDLTGFLLWFSFFTLLNVLCSFITK